MRDETNGRQSRPSSKAGPPALRDEPSPGRTLRRLWRRHIRPHWPILALNLGVIFLFASANALYPGLIKMVVDALSPAPAIVGSAADAGAAAAESAIAAATDATSEAVDYFAWLTPQGPEDLSVVLFLIIGVTALKGVTLYAHKILTARVLARIDTDLQGAMYRRLMDADMAFLATEAPTALAARFTADILLVRQAVDKLIVSLVRDLLMVIGLIAGMFLIDWELTLLALAVFPLAILPLASISSRLRKLAKTTQRQIGAMTALVQESLAGVRMAKTYQIEGYLKSKTAASFERLRGLKVKAASQHALIDPMMEVLGGVAVAGVLYFIGARIAAGENTLGDIMGFVTAMLLAAQPMRALGNLSAQVSQGLVGAQRIFALLDARPQIQDRSGAAPLSVDEGRIEFKDVVFHYARAGEEAEGGPAALNGFDLVVPAGARVALVGRSGAGKSTVFNLLPRLYDVSSGAILIDGRDLRDAPLRDLRAAMALVAQDATLFNDTIRANIAFGAPPGRGAASDAAIRRAAAAAAAHDFITALPEGYDTVVGDRGDRLSGGQRQRISIARAFLRDAPILLLDEATSALDAESEAAVKAALDRLAEGRTTLIVAHRLSTVVDADVIAVMDAGRVVELGRHQELLAQGGLYATLHRLQFEG